MKFSKNRLGKGVFLVFVCFLMMFVVEFVKMVQMESDYDENNANCVDVNGETSQFVSFAIKGGLAFLAGAIMSNDRFLKLGVF